VFRADELTTAAAPTAGYQQDSTGAASQRDMLRRLELSDAEYAKLRAHCDASGVLFLATPFSVGDVARLIALRVPAIKIASTDLNNTPLLAAAGATGLPLIVSTGAAEADEIRAAVARFRDERLADRVALLHCVSSYPAPLAALNLRAIAALQALAGVPVGFSDHATSTHTGAWAVAAGACIIEKHITYDRTAAGPDHAASLDAVGFADYVQQIREVESALGRGELGMTELEADVRRVARKSVVATRAIRAGERLTADMLTLKRPGGGLEPHNLDKLIGRKAAADIAADAPVAWDQIVGGAE
jgi:N,N'-diacetyllegionaminate synthase